jgi:hypothetical protein
MPTCFTADLLNPCGIDRDNDEHQLENVTEEEGHFISSSP